MTSCADQCADPCSHRKNTHAHARAYGIAAQILPSCHKLKYLVLLAQILAAILSATGTNAQHRQLAGISATEHLLLALTILRNYRQQNHHGQHQEPRRAVSIRNQRENHWQLAPRIAQQGKHQQPRAESPGIGIRNRLARFEMLKSPESAEVGYGYQLR